MTTVLNGVFMHGVVICGLGIRVIRCPHNVSPVQRCTHSSEYIAVPQPYVTASGDLIMQAKYACYRLSQRLGIGLALLLVTTATSSLCWFVISILAHDLLDCTS